MAQVPYNEGIPEVAPRESVPDDYQHIQANPNQFGGLIARGAQELGQGATTAAKFYGEAVADDAANQYQERVTKLLYGDPSKQSIGPDGKPVQDTGYFGLKGRAALDARPNLDGQIDSLTKELRGNLSSPEQQLQFDNFTRRYRSLTASEVGRRADQQSNTWYTEVNDKTAKQQLDLIATNADKPDVVAHATRDLIDARVKTAQLQGGGDELVSAAVAQGKKEAAVAQIDAIAGGGDWERAQRMTDNYKNILGTDYERVANAVREHANDQIADKAATRAIGSSPAAASPVMPVGAGAATSQAVHSAIINQESGGNPRESTSITGAVGIGQIEPATFKQYARPGEDIRNPADNLVVSQRIIDDYYKRYNGDPARVAVAYFSGPGNVAPAGSPTPYIQNRADPTGKTTASYVADIQRRLNAPDAKSSAYQVALNDPQLQDNPKAMHMALQKISQQLSAQEIADNQTAQQKKRATDKAIGGYITQFYDMLHSPNPDFVGLAGQINHDTTLADDGPARAALIDRIRRYDPSEQTLMFGTGYRAAREALFSAPDAPGHIDSVAGLVNQPDITLDGLKDLHERLALAKSGPDRMANEKIINSFLADANRQMVHDQDVGNVKIPDPKGAHLYNSEFVPRFMKQISQLEQQAEKSGNWDKFNQFLSRESVDKMINDIYPQAQRNMDRVSAEGDAGAGADTLPPAPAGIAPKAWQTVMATRPIAADGKPVHPDRWGEALQILRANPTPETIATFNSHFKARGFDGQDLLDKLGPAAPTQPEGATAAPAAGGASPPAIISHAATPAPASEDAAAMARRRGAVGGYQPPSAEELRRGEAEIAASRAEQSRPHEQIVARRTEARKQSREAEEDRIKKEHTARIHELDQEEADIKSRDFMSREMQARLNAIEAEKTRLRP